MAEGSNKSAWAWVPSIYFVQGIPYILVNSVSVILLKNLGLDNSEIALYTSWLNLPWVLKPLWSPFVDVTKTKRSWMLLMQFFISLSLLLICFSLHLEHFVAPIMVCFTLMAFFSATNDTVTDGFYMIGLNDKQQSFFVGIRNTFYRVAMITGLGGLTYLAGQLEEPMGVKNAWTVAFGAMAILFFILLLYHTRSLPNVENKSQFINKGEILSDSWIAIKSYFQKKNIIVALLFILLYRFGEAQLVKLVSPFMLDPRDVGGLGISTSQLGIIYGTVGIIFLVIGGILGGVLASKYGFDKMIWWMAIAMNIPNAFYIVLAAIQPENLYLISTAVVIEQFGYGFGFTGFTLYILNFSKGSHKTTHYAISTGIMAAGLLIPGMISGFIQESIGYTNFFIWVLLSSIPGLLLIPFLKVKEK